jgi:lipoprotein-anchoring transpeptidase ErfK/SrfK
MVVAGVATLALAGSGPASVAAVSGPGAGPAVATVQPANGDVVGVAMPITLNFAEPVLDRAAAERSVRITSSHPATGRFTWLSNTVTQWVPDGLWPAHSEIAVAAGGLKTDFQTGSEVLGVASLSQHTFTVSVDGQIVRTMPASMGKPTRPTPVGTFSALEKDRTIVFDSRTIGIPLDSPEGYLLDGEYAVRVTWGGVFVHSAPWSVAQQGHTNVSHGCINLSPDNAAWYFNTVHVGDPIVVND